MQRLDLPDLETAHPARQMTRLASEEGTPESAASPGAPSDGAPRGVWIHIAAFSLTLFWIGGVGAFVVGLYGMEGLRAAPPLLVAQIAAGILLPVAFIWIAALTLRRAQELGHTAAALADITRHLLQPEDSAAREVTRVGHAVRRQVAGLENAIAGIVTKISDLEEEIYQHTDNLSRTSDKAEERIEAVRAMLARERAELESLTQQLDGQGGALTQTLKAHAQELAQASHLAFDKIKEADTMLAARMNTFEGTANAAHQTSQKASRELDHQCAKLEAVADAALTRADVIAGRYDKQRAAIGEATEKLARENAKLEAGFEQQRNLLAAVAELAAGEARRIEQAISLSARELEGAIEAAAGRASNVGDDFKQQAQSVRIGADEAAAALTRAAHSAAQAADTAGTTIKAHAAEMATTISESGVAANNAALHAHASFEEYAEALQHSIEKSGEALEEASRGVMTKLDAHLATLAEQITAQGAAVDRAASDAVATTRQHLEDRFADIRTELAGARHWISEAVQDITAALEQTGGTLGDSLAALLNDAQTTLEDGAANLRDTVTESVKGMARDAASLNHDMEEQAQNLTARIAGLAKETHNSADQAMNSTRGAIEITFTKIQEHLTASRHSLDETAKQLAARMDKLSTRLDAATGSAMAKAGAALDARSHALEEGIAKAGEAAQHAAHQALSTFDSQAQEIAARFDKTGALITDAAGASTEKLHVCVREIEGEITAAGELVDGAAAQLATTAEGIKTAAAQAEGGLTQALKDLESLMAEFPGHAQTSARHIREVIEAQLTSFTDIAEKTAARAQALDSAFQARLKVQYDTLGELLGGGAVPENPSPSPGPVAPSLAHTMPPAPPAPDPQDTKNAAPAPAESVSDPESLPDSEPETQESPYDPDAGDADSLARRLARRLRRFSNRETQDRPVPATRLDLAITAGPEEMSGADAAAPSAHTESSVPPHTPANPAAKQAGQASPAHKSNRLSSNPTMRWREILAAVETNGKEDPGTTYAAPDSTSSDEMSRTSLHAIETLQAMTVDLDRALEIDPPVDLVERYVGGDRNLFAKRLIRMKQDDLFDRIGQKYQNDIEFRSYADSYMTQFEDLLKNTAQEDREDILTETYLSSDTGKLYLLLARALDRKA